MPLLTCAIVGVRGSAFTVIVGKWKTVSLLKEAIKKQKMYQFPADQLRLFLTKRDGVWLSSSTKDVKKLKQGMMTPLLEKLTEKNLELQGKDTIAQFLQNANTPKAGEIHVLVLGSLGSVNLRVKEVDNNADYKDELTHYQQRGELIQRNCENYCQQILSKIDALYALSGWFGLPFICVEGSSGVGKSQLAFALGGNRPWFYWPVAIGPDSQPLYKNFSSISDAFLEVTNKDDPTKGSEEDILDRTSLFYNTESLWTFGFIRALLKYCSKEQNQQGHMILFQEETSLYVEKCNRETVVAFRENMKAEGKVLPFFVLDEMTLNTHVDGGGKKLAAFQRNVFRVCALVVVLMGSDDKITKMICKPPLGSYCGRHAWMTIFSRFLPY
ncbi:hypothetical protein KXD40_008960 [Peronospora effusa]|nr:hypothetical protein KXD40_008960 [Peronospora effusa]